MEAFGFTPNFSAWYGTRRSLDRRMITKPVTVYAIPVSWRKKSGNAYTVTGFLFVADGCHRVERGGPAGGDDARG
jgi:hypothetical protein